MSIRSIAAVVLTSSILLGSPAAAWAASGHGDDETLEHRVDTEKLSGFNRLLGRLYNGNKWLFAAVVTVTMALMGAVIAVSVDILLRRLGLDVKRMTRRE